MLQGSLQDANFIWSISYTRFNLSISPKSGLSTSLNIAQMSCLVTDIHLLLHASVSAVCSSNSNSSISYELIAAHSIPGSIRSILQFSIFAYLCFSANDTLAWLAATSPFQYSELWNVVNVNKQVLALAAIPGAVLQEFWQRSEVKLRGSMILADFELRTLSTPLTDPSCRPWDKTIRN